MSLRLKSILFFLIFSAVFSAGAQIVSFDRKDAEGSFRTAKIRLRLSREYTFMIPGAGRPIQKSEFADLVLLTGITVRKLNEKGFPCELELTPAVLGGTLNGRKLEPSVLQNRKILAVLEKYPCEFRPLDGQPLSEEAGTVLSAVFRVQQNISLADVLGKERQYRQGESWIPNTKPVLDLLSGRQLPLKRNEITAAARFENIFKVDGVKCTAVVLTLSSTGTFSHDFRLRTRIVLPVRESDGGIVSMTREGTEIIDRKMLSGDPAASGASVRLMTSEQMEITYVRSEKKSGDASSDFFRTLFR